MFRVLTFVLNSVMLHHITRDLLGVANVRYCALQHCCEIEPSYIFDSNVLSQVSVVEFMYLHCESQLLRLTVDLFYS